MRALILAVLSLVFTACGPAPAAQGGPALWRIADEDSQIWLFGSVHMLPEGIAWRSKAVNSAFAQADELVLETDASDAGAAQVTELAARLGRLGPGESLSAALDPRSAARLARVCASLALDCARLDTLRHWLAGLTVSIAYAAHEGHAQERGVEAVLLAEAQARRLTVSFFETPEEQLRFLADLAPADEARFLAATLRQIEEEPESVAALDAAWARGDAAALDALVREEIMEAGPAVYAAIIARRNHNWAAQVEQRLAGEGRIFVAVGAAHMLGEDGLVTLLRARGITVEGP